MKTILSDLINGNMAEAKGRAELYTQSELTRAFIRYGKSDTWAHAAALYLKEPSQATYDEFCKAESRHVTIECFA